MSEEQDFRNTPDAVSSARRYTLGALEGLDPKAEEAIALMVSELATNCIRHASTSFSIAVEQTDEYVRIVVTDTGSGDPTVEDPTPTQPTGRGLRIVSALADEWGVTKHRVGTGKSVWFTVWLSASVDAPRRTSSR